MHDRPEESSGGIDRWLAAIEKAGNRLPHPALLFCYFALAVLPLSALVSWSGFSVTHPATGETLNAINLLDAQGVQRILAEAARNFTQFAPVGTVIIAMLGMGLAERSGLIAHLLGGWIKRTPQILLPASVVFLGVLSSIAADAGYVVLIPLAALVFHAAGRHPLAGIAACFAGVSGGFSANLVIGPVDVMLAGISTEAIHLIDPAKAVGVTDNYYFLVASTLLITALGSWITTHVVEPRLGTPPKQPHAPQSLTSENDRPLHLTVIAVLAMLVLVIWSAIDEQGWLYSADGNMANSPLLRSIVPLLAIVAGVAGILYGRLSGRFRNGGDTIHALEETMRTMAPYLVLMFFAAQFVNWFAWSNMGVLIAISGAQALQNHSLPPVMLYAIFILLAAGLNLLIGSASAKWALIAPVFIPLFALLGFPPHEVQAAYRIADSSTNIITPLMPYFPLVLAYMRQYAPQTGMGTIMALMMPYGLVFLFCWSLLFFVWIALGWPLGPFV